MLNVRYVVLAGLMALAAGCGVNRSLVIDSVELSPGGERDSYELVTVHDDGRAEFRVSGSPTAPHLVLAPGQRFQDVSDQWLTATPYVLLSVDVEDQTATLGYPAIREAATPLTAWWLRLTKR